MMEGGEHNPRPVDVGLVSSELLRLEVSLSSRVVLEELLQDGPKINPSLEKDQQYLI